MVSFDIKVVKTTTDNGSNFIKPFGVFAPTEDELDVSITDMNDIFTFSDEDESLELPSHQKCAAHSLNLVSTTAAAETDNQYSSRATFAKCQAL
jgi:hypothetical protein